MAKSVGNQPATGTTPNQQIYTRGIVVNGVLATIILVASLFAGYFALADDREHAYWLGLALVVWAYVGGVIAIILGWLSPYWRNLGQWALGRLYQKVRRWFRSTNRSDAFTREGRYRDLYQVALGLGGTASGVCGLLLCLSIEQERFGLDLRTVAISTLTSSAVPLAIAVAIAAFISVALLSGINVFERWSLKRYMDIDFAAHGIEWYDPHIHRQLRYVVVIDAMLSVGTGIAVHSILVNGQQASPIAIVSTAGAIIGVVIFSLCYCIRITLVTRH